MLYPYTCTIFIKMHTAVQKLWCTQASKASFINFIRTDHECKRILYYYRRHLQLYINRKKDHNFIYIFFKIFSKPLIILGCGNYGLSAILMKAVVADMLMGRYTQRQAIKPYVLPISRNWRHVRKYKKIL